MSRLGVEFDPGELTILDYKDGSDAPYCDNPACYVHADSGAEHHIEGCLIYETVAQATHRFDHACTKAVDDLANAWGTVPGWIRTAAELHARKPLRFLRGLFK